MILNDGGGGKPRSDSIWDQWLDNAIPDSAATLGDIGTSVLGGVAAVADKVMPDIHPTVPRLQSNGTWKDVTDESTTSLLGAVASAAVQPIVAPSGLASKGLTAAESYGFGRPASVMGQAFNQNNPLYADGLQLSDFQKMWNASRSSALQEGLVDQPGISPEQGAWWGVLSGVKSVFDSDATPLERTKGMGTALSYFLPGAGLGIAAVGLGANAVVPQQAPSAGAKPIDIYDPAQQKELYDNSLFSVTTGLSDAALQIYALGKGGDALAVAGKRAVGLNTTIDSTRDLSKAGGEIMNHLAYVESEGAQGKWTAWGYHVVKVAESTSAADIAASPLFKGSPKALELGSMLEGVSDPLTVAKVALADRGDRFAIAALMRDDRDFAWTLTDQRFKLQMQDSINQLPTINKNNVDMVSSVYDQSLERPGREFYKTAYDNFLHADVEKRLDGTDPSGLYDATTVNNVTKPITGVFGKIAIRMGDSRYNAAMGKAPTTVEAGKATVSAMQPDIGSGWVQHVFGPLLSKEPVTVGVQWLGGRRPSGHIDMYLPAAERADEMMATVGRLKWTRGERQWSFVRDGQEVNIAGPQWREEAISRLAYAARQGDTASQTTMAELESELISSVLKQHGLTRDQAEAQTKLIMDKKTSTLTDARETGFFFDSSGNRVLLHPQSRRQLIDSYVMFPIEEFSREMRDLSMGIAGKNGRRIALNTRHRADLTYEVIQKYMRTEQLIRLSYMKNSLVEPIGARIAQEGIDQLLPLAKDAGVGAFHFFKNRAKSAGVGAYWVGDRLHVTGSTRINNEIFTLHQERLKLEDQLDNLEAALHTAADPAVNSPAHAAHMRTVLDAQAREAKASLEKLWDEADLRDPGWRSSHSLPTFSDVRNEVNALHRVTSDPQTIHNLRKQLALREVEQEMRAERVRSVAATNAEAARVKLASIDAKLAAADDPTLDGMRELDAARHRSLRSLQLHENRLEWARREAAGSPALGVVEQRKSVQAELDALLVEKDRLQASFNEVGDGTGKLDALTQGVSPKTAEIDAKIASREAVLRQLAGEQTDLAVAKDVQEILDTFPGKIQELRDGLGDWQPRPRIDPEAQVMADFYPKHISNLRAAIKQTNADADTQIAGLREFMPEFQPGTMGMEYVPTAEEQLHIESAAAKAWADEMDTHKLSSDGIDRRLDPFELWPDIPVDASARSVWEKEGQIPLAFAEKVLTKVQGADRGMNLGGRGEAFWLWLHDGVPEGVSADVYDAAQPQGMIGELRALAHERDSAYRKQPRKPLTADEWASVKDGTATPEQLTKFRKRVLTGEQEAHMKAIGYKPVARRASGGKKREWITAEWFRPLSKDGQKRGLEAAQDAEYQQLHNAKADEAAHYQEAIDQHEAARAADLAEYTAEIRKSEQALADIHSGTSSEYGPTKLTGVAEPIPGPYSVDRLRADRADTAEALRRHEATLAAEHVDSPQVTALREDLARYERIATTPGAAAEVDRLRILLSDAANSRMAVGNPIVSLPKQIEELQARIASLSKKAGVVQSKAVRSRQRRDWLASRTRAGEAPITVKAGGSTLKAEGLFSPRQFGEARRNSASAAYTNRATFDPGQTSLANSELISLTQGSKTVLPTDPMFFHELTYIANRHIAGDDLLTRIMRGHTNTEIKAWQQTPGGQKYMSEMGWTPEMMDPSIVSSVADQTVAGKRVPVWDDGKLNTLRRILHAYFPTDEAKRAALHGDTSPSEMQAAFGDFPMDQMSPVQGHLLTSAKSGQLGFGWLRRGLDNAWDWLATKPENVISRWPFAAKMYKNEVQRRLQFMADQGVHITGAEFNAVAQAAIQYTLREGKRTFYNISRYSNPVYAARYALVYPQAVFNTLWRAARLAYRKPGTAMVMNEAWTSFFTSYGVDKDGKHTTDYTKVDSLIIPVPSQLQNVAAVAPVAKLPANAFQLLSDRMGATWTIQIPAQTLLVNKPETADLLKKALGPGFDVIFPFGVPSGLNDYMLGPVPVGTFLPNYVKSLAGALGIDDEKHIRIATQQYEYALAKYDRALEKGENPGPKPTVEAASAAATNYWFVTALAQEGIPGGGGLQPAGQIELDAIRAIVTKHNGDREAALPEIQQAFPDLSAMDMMASTSEYRAYVPSTVEAYKLVTDRALFPMMQKITQWGDGDPQMIELLTADKQGEFDANVYDSLGKMTLPGDNQYARSKPSTAVVAARLDAGKSWESYNRSRAALMAEVTRRGLKSVPRDLQDQWNVWMGNFQAKPENKAWAAQYGKRDSSEAMRAIDTYTLALRDPAMAKYRTTAYWKAVDKYMRNLPVAQQAYRSAPDSNSRAEIASQWETYVGSSISPLDPFFTSMYNQHLSGYDIEVK